MTARPASTPPLPALASSNEREGTAWYDLGRDRREPPLAAIVASAKQLPAGRDEAILAGAPAQLNAV